MSMMVSFVLSFFPRDVLDEILNLIESVSEDFPSYSLSSVILLFVKICLSIFSFDVWDRLWVRIRPVPEVPLLI